MEGSGGRGGRAAGGRVCFLTSGAVGVVPPVTSKPACQGMGAGHSGVGPSGKGTKQDIWAESAGGGEGGNAEHYRQFGTRGGSVKDRDKRWLTFERRL